MINCKVLQSKQLKEYIEKALTNMVKNLIKNTKEVLKQRGVFPFEEIGKLTIRITDNNHSLK